MNLHHLLAVVYAALVEGGETVLVGAVRAHTQLQQPPHLLHIVPTPQSTIEETVASSVANPDPSDLYVFGPPGSGSASPDPSITEKKLVSK
jgi:hypothetical protein